jgi:hypothetical protein
MNWSERTLERAGAADGAAARPLERPGPSPTGNLVPPWLPSRRAKGALDCSCVKGGRCLNCIERDGLTR